MTVSADQAAAERENAAAVFKTLPRDELLLDYQAFSVKAVMLGSWSLIAIEKSRRIGLTWGLAYAAVEIAASGLAAGGDNVFYMGYEQEMAREFIDACAMWAKALTIVAGAVGEEIFKDQDADGNSRDIKAFRISFASGFKIVALASMPRAFRGKQGVVIIDEAAFHSALAEKIKAALALLMWGGKVVIVSTHDGVANPFNQLIDDIRARRQRGKVIRISFDDAIADGLYERIALVARMRSKSVLPKDEWIADIRAYYGDNASEELDVIPKEGGGSLIKAEDLAACESDDAGNPELYQGGLFYIGRDVARRNDGQIIWGFELVGDVLWLRDRWEGVGETFKEQADQADLMFQRRRVVQYWIDQGGMGEQPVEDAKRLYGESRVSGELLIGQNRLDLAVGLATRFERGLIRIPKDPVIRADLRAIKRLPSTGGNVRVADDPKGTVHADRFWAAALASRAADLPAATYDYRPVKRPPPPGSEASSQLSMRPDHSGDDFGSRGGRGTW